MPLPSRLYLIVDPLDTGREPLALAQAMLAGGARLLQLRLKHETETNRFLAHAAAIREATTATGATFIVNDRADIAAAVGADGVHLGQDDLPIEAARGLLGPQALIGLSTHDERQLATAANTSADYLSLGPLFPTTSKANPDPVVGTDRLAAARIMVRHPLVAIGGITATTAADALASGADAIAVISDIVRAPDVQRATADLLESLE